MGIYSSFAGHITTIATIKAIPSYRIRLLGDLKQFQDVLNIFRNQELYYYFNEEEIVILPYWLSEDKKLFKIYANIKDKPGYYSKVLDKIATDFEGNILETNQNVVKLGEYSYWFALVEFPQNTTKTKLKQTLKGMDEIYKDKELYPQAEPLNINLKIYQKFEGKTIKFVPESKDGGYLPVPKEIIKKLLKDKKRQENVIVFLHADLENRTLRIRLLKGLYAEIKIFFDDQLESLRNLVRYLADKLKLNILKDKKRILVKDFVSKLIVIADLQYYAKEKGLLDDREIIKKKLISDLREYRGIRTREDLKKFNIRGDLEVNFIA